MIDTSSISIDWVRVITVVTFHVNPHPTTNDFTVGRCILEYAKADWFISK